MGPSCKVAIIAGLLLGVGVAGSLRAAPTPAQRKALNELRTELGKAPGLIAKKKLDEAETLLSDVEARLEKIAAEGDFDATDAALVGVRKLLETQRGKLEGKEEGRKKGEVSFTADIAPLVQAKCVQCHEGENGRGQLALDSYAGMEKGGRSGPLLTPGRPQASLLMGRVTAGNAGQRMPKDGEPLTQAELQKLSGWIAAGAKFDGDERTTKLSDLARESKTKSPPVKIEMAAGDEKVSFRRDLAEVFANTCGACHNNNQRRGGLSVATFEALMRGGESGAVIVPGHSKESRLWKLVWAEDTPVMPAGMFRIPKKWADDLTTWIDEGAKFDGGDSKKLLADLLPSDEEKQRAELAGLSPAEWLTRRQSQADDMWKKTLRSAEPNRVATEEFLLLGDVPQDRLEQVAQWAEAQLKAVRALLQLKESPAIHGKLPVFVYRDRFNYEEFHRSVQKRDVPLEIVGYARVSLGQGEAYVVLQDLDDEATLLKPTMELNVAEQVTSALLKRHVDDLPEWFTRGAGVALSPARSKASAYTGELRRRAADACAKLSKPEEVFVEGTFSPADSAAVGFALVEFLLKQGGTSQLGQLAQRLGKGETSAAAIGAVYRAEPSMVGAKFLQSVGSNARLRSR